MRLATKHQNTYIKKNPWSVPLNSARQRCNNKNDTSYKNYGGKGISCSLTMRQIRYLFERDDGWNLKRPSLDRIESKGNYVISNCRFIELSENVLLGLKERYKNLSEYCECGKTTYAKGFCRLHYQIQWRANNKTVAERYKEI